MGGWWCRFKQGVFFTGAGARRTLGYRAACARVWVWENRQSLDMLSGGEYAGPGGKKSRGRRGKGAGCVAFEGQRGDPQGSVATLPALQHSQTLWAFGQGRAWASLGLPWTLFSQQ